MHRLERIIVRGFRGQSRPIELDLKPDANFLIGRNGTGKTTLINLIHAALSMDIPALRESSFEKVEFLFKRPRHRVKPRFSVIRAIADDGTPRISYKVAESATAATDDYIFNQLRKRPGLNLPVAHSGDSSAAKRLPLRDRLASIYQTTWLSLQRGADKLAPAEDWADDTRPDIDRKLDNLSNDLTRYFSRLDRQVAQKTQLFQKEWFLSFLANDRRTKEQDIDRLDEATERGALAAIFNDFKMQPEEYSSQLEKHFRLARRAQASFKEQQTAGISIKDWLVAVDVMRLHLLVEQWQVLEKSKEEIYRPRIEFETVASDMLFKKNLITNSSNQILIRDANSDDLDLGKLSSGEKQLLIFLSETLLQEQKPFIFLADEPELSMHVQWQEDLVPSLLKINPNAQVLFATHSPDVVNSYQDNVFRMEDLVD